MVKKWGSGKPDYSTEVARGLVRPGMKTIATETYANMIAELSTIPSTYPYVTSPLSSGSTTHLYYLEQQQLETPTGEGVMTPLWDTGKIMPVTVSAGRDFKMLRVTINVDQPIRLRVFFDKAFVGEFYQRAYDYLHKTEFASLSLSTADPDLSDSHDIDMRYTNMGTDDLHGHINIIWLAEEYV